MEKIGTLIEKLYQQKQQNAPSDILLFTVQMLHAELLQLQQKNSSIGTSKVAVSLPVNLNFVEDVVKRALKEAEEMPEQKAFTQPVKEKVEKPEKKETEPYHLHKPAVVETAAPPQPAPQAAPAQPAILNPAFDIEPELPTLAQYNKPRPEPKERYELKPPREIHEMIGDSKESLNDRLKEEKTELAHVLTGTPIKDLRKAIGINDRFTFINELFRGDEAMYERSIKTINNFNIYSEAQYWIHRELTHKLGWNDSNPTVQHFYQLVRRRFS